MRLRFALLLVGAAFASRGENACPWLNAATAAGILGGPVTSSVTPAICEFVRDSGSHKSTLHIEVRKKPVPLSAKCDSPAMPLMAIGNEATACSAGNSQMVIGRVRDQRFLVWLHTGDPSKDAATVKERTRKAAEQVAGNLF